MDENGIVVDLELAKLILIEFFSTGEYLWHSHESEFKEFYEKIKSELVDNGDYFTFVTEDGKYEYFGGPEGVSGYWIRCAEEYIKDLERVDAKDICQVLNNQHIVFYPIDGKLKCFVIYEGD